MRWNHERRALTALVACLVLCATSVSAEQERYFEIESIDLPNGLEPEVGALDFLPDGRLVAAFRRGEVYYHNPGKGTWELFARGLHGPLGVHVESERELVIAQKPELTRLVDTTGDGRADRFETVTDEFGMSGNYGEFLFGPAHGKDGQMFIIPMTASPAGFLSDEPRGEKLDPAPPGVRHSYGPYRGWVLRVDPETGETTPWASGVRSPNGLVVDNDGRLFVTDNQGDWVGTDVIYHVQRDRFYGHPRSLVWKDDWDKGDPDELGPEKLTEMRTRPMIKFSRSMVRSPTQPIFVEAGGAFGPYEGQMIVGEMNHPHIMRIMLDEVNGELQGASTTLIQGGGLGIGNNRLVFGPDNALWVGKIQHGWPGQMGMRRITWTGQTPLDVLKMELTADGFDLTFTKPVDAETAGDPQTYQFRRYYYRYDQAYGSPQLGETEVAVTDAIMSSDAKRVSLELEELKPGWLYEMQLSGVRSEDDEAVLNNTVVYTLNRLIDGTTAYPQFEDE